MENPTPHDPDLRQAPSTGSDARGFAIAGALLLTLAGYFVWHDLNVDADYLLLATALAALAAQVTQRPRVLPDLGLALLLGCTVVGGAWLVVVANVAQPSPAQARPLLLLAIMGIAVAACVATLARRYLSAAPGPLPARVVFPTTLIGLMTSAALYYWVFTLGVAAEHVGRRLILTLAWLVVGLGLDLMGHERRERRLTQAGLLVVTFAVAKALFYDMSHLDGILRVGVLGCAGLLLVGSAALRQRSRQART